MRYLILPETPNFGWLEGDRIACPRTGHVKITPNFLETIKLLQALRTWYGGSLVITSGFRCPEHNESVGGAADSQHLLTDDPDDQRFGVDLAPSALSPRVPLRTPMSQILETMARKAEAIGFTGIGLYDAHLHLDRRPGALVTWDERGSRR